MNTFSSIAQESKVSDLTRSELLTRLGGDIHEKINQRGSREQYASLLLNHYYPNENIRKRLCKGTYSSGAEFFSKY